MVLTWIYRLLVLFGEFSLHWALGVFLIVELFLHMNKKARLYDQGFNAGSLVAGPDGRPLRTPW